MPVLIYILMVESGSFPEDLSVEKVTSAESMVNNKGRDSTSKRMLDRFPNSEGVELREMYNTGSIETNIDCNSSPKPAVCGVGVELPGGG
jgi:hypothetical protein